MEGKSAEFEHWLSFARKVYGDALDTSGLARKWRRWFRYSEPPLRVLVRFADGVERYGVIGVTKGPEPRFVLRRNASSGGGVPLRNGDKVVAVQSRHGYQKIGARA